MNASPWLTGTVMAHPRRRTEAERLAALGPDGLLRVTLDPEPDGPPTALRTAALAWSSVPSRATHHLVLQDDVELAEGFFEHAQAAAAAMPEAALAFYVNWNARNGGAVRMAALAGADWAAAVPEYAPCVALLLPAAVARGYREYAESEGAGWPYDVLMYRYLRSRGVPLRLAVPNTVQHSALPSLAGNAAHGLRRSALFSPVAPDRVSARCADLPVVPFYKHGLAQSAVRGPGGQRDGGWACLETWRQLRRDGVDLDACREAFAAVAEPKSESAPGLPAEAAWQTWLTGYAMGRATTRAGGSGEPGERTAVAALDTLGPGGLCDELTPGQLAELRAPLRALAEAGLSAGERSARRAAPRRRQRPPTVVVGAADPFADELVRLLGDLGHRVERSRGPLPARGLPKGARLVQLASPNDSLTDLQRLLRAGARTDAARLVLAVGVTWPVGEGKAEAEPLAEDFAPAPGPGAAAGRLWQMEELVRRARERGGLGAHVVRFAPPVGAFAPEHPLLSDWVLRAWTRRPIPVDPARVHQLVDARDLAAALDAVLRGRTERPVLNIASATLPETELAELVCRTARRAPLVEQPRSEARRFPLLATGSAPKPLGAEDRTAAESALRSYAQWLAYDTECPR